MAYNSARTPNSARALAAAAAPAALRSPQLEGRQPIIVQLGVEAVPYILEIERQSQPAPWSQATFEREFELPHSFILGARLKGEVVGFVVLHVIVDELHILNLAVAPQWRRRGIARAMLQRVVEEGKKRGARRVLLEVRETNKEAHCLYQEAGFAIDGTRPRYYSDSGEAALLLSYSLAA